MSSPGTARATSVKPPAGALAAAVATGAEDRIAALEARLAELERRGGTH